MKLAPHILECPLCSGQFRFVDTFRNHVRYDHADADEEEETVVEEKKDSSVVDDAKEDIQVQEEDVLPPAVDDMAVDGPDPLREEDDSPETPTVKPCSVMLTQTPIPKRALKPTIIEQKSTPTTVSASEEEVKKRGRPRKTPKTPKMPRTPKTPKMPKTTRTPRTPRTPKTPKAPMFGSSTGKKRGRKMYPRCPICEHKFKTAELVEQHFALAHVTEHVCEMCEQTFPFKLDLDEHVRLVHGVDVPFKGEEEEEEEEEPMFVAV